MFQSARLKLTAWYLLIIMAVSIAFSTFIYFGATREFDRILRIQRYRIENPNFRLRQLQPLLPPRSVDPDVMEEASTRVLEGLVGVNLVVLIFSSLAGYFLAGQTLLPIANMVEEQKRFITDASHELRTPITALRTEIEVGLRDKELSLTEAKKLLESGLEEAKNLQVLSDYLLALATPLKPNTPLLFETIALSVVINEAIRKVNPLAKKKQIEVRSSVKNENILGDKQSLVQLFVILLDNAVKYSKKGGKISLDSNRKENTASVSVKDDGVGIPKSELSRIFDRFFRIDASRTKEKTSGYGLGLAIAKNIVEMHGGSITVNSIVGKGSTFTVNLKSA